MNRLDPRLRLLTLALLVGAAFLVVALSGSLSADGVRDRVDALGAAGPLLFIPISACLTVALFPGPLLAGASGLLFGTALGTPVSIVVGDARRHARLLACRAGGRTTPCRSSPARA